MSIRHKLVVKVFKYSPREHHTNPRHSIGVGFPTKYDDVLKAWLGGRDGRVRASLSTAGTGTLVLRPDPQGKPLGKPSGTSNDRRLGWSEYELTGLRDQAEIASMEVEATLEGGELTIVLPHPDRRRRPSMQLRGQRHRPAEAPPAALEAPPAPPPAEPTPSAPPPAANSVELRFGDGSALLYRNLTTADMFRLQAELVRHARPD